MPNFTFLEGAEKHAGCGGVGWFQVATMFNLKPSCLELL